MSSIANLVDPTRRLAEPTLRDRLAQWLCSGLLGAWFAYLLVAPTLGIDWIDSWHNEQRVLEVILLIATTAALGCGMLSPTWRARLPRVHWTVVAVFALGSASALRAQYRDAAFAEIGLHLLLLVLILLTAATLARDAHRGMRFVRWGALMLLAVYVAGVAVRYAAALSIRQALNLDVLLLGYANPRFPSALHALLLPFVAALSLDPAESRWLRRGALVVLAATWAVNLALGTRAVWFAYLLGFALLFALVGRRRLWPLARVTLLTALGGVLLYFVFFKFVPVWTGIGETFTERTLDKLAWGTNRELLIASSWQAVRSAPWLGLGPMQFAAIPQVWAAHPHNWILQLASEWGLPATALALLGITRLLRGAAAAARQSARPGADDALVALTASLIALVYGLVDGNLVMPVSQAAAAIVFGTLLSVCAAPAAPWHALHRPARAPRAGPLLAGALVLLAAAAQLSWYTATTVAQATAQEAPQRISPTRALWPRFWSDGLLPIRH
jgi:O-antigen ligase